MDDAILSVGGQLLLRKGKCKITILCIFGTSNYTSYMESEKAYLDTELITKIRRDESILAASKVGANFISLDFLDAPLRMQDSTEWNEKYLSSDYHKAQGYISNHPIPHHVNEISALLDEILNEQLPDEVWIPMGLGNHVDHKTTRAACLKTLSTKKICKSKLQIRLYEDLPYSSPNHCQQVIDAFKDVGTSLTLKTEDISTVMNKKLETVGVFLSQFKIQFMAPRLLQAAAKIATEAGFSSAGESSYLLNGTLNIPKEIMLSTSKKVSLIEESDALAFRETISQFKSLTILTLPSGITGDIPDVAKALMDLFPEKINNILSVSETRESSYFTSFSNMSIGYIPKNSWQCFYELIKIISKINQPLIIIKCSSIKFKLVDYLFFKSMTMTRSVLVSPSLSNLVTYWETISQDNTTSNHRLIQKFN